MRVQWHEKYQVKLRVLWGKKGNAGQHCNVLTGWQP